MRMRASPGAGVGVGRSRRVRTSAEPVVRIWMACMSMPEYNSWCVAWVWFPREVRSEDDSRFLPRSTVLRVRNDKNMRTGNGKSKDQSRSPSGMTSKKNSSKANANGFRLNLRYQILGCGLRSEILR